MVIQFLSVTLFSCPSETKVCFPTLKVRLSASTIVKTSGENSQHKSISIDCPMVSVEKKSKISGFKSIRGRFRSTGNRLSID